MSLLLFGCSEHLCQLDFVRVQHQMPSDDACVLMFFCDWELSDILRLWGSASHTQVILSCMYVGLYHPATPFLLSQTIPVSSDFCTTWLIVDLAGVCHLLNLLWNCLCTITKLLVWYNVLTINTCSSTRAHPEVDNQQLQYQNRYFSIKNRHLGVVLPAPLIFSWSLIQDLWVDV